MSDSFSPFCPDHGLGLEPVAGVDGLQCPICGVQSPKPAKALCSAGTAGRACFRMATILARPPQWSGGASPSCPLHRPPAGWIVLATNTAGFEIDSGQVEGTPAYYGVTAGPRAQCCAAVERESGSGHRVCGQPAVTIARMPGWTRSASPFCADHSPSPGWVIMATNIAGFEIDLDQPAGTPAYYGIKREDLIHERN